MRMSLMLPVAAALAAAVIGISSPASATTIEEAIKLCKKNPQCSMGSSGTGYNLKVGTNEIYCPEQGDCVCLLCSPPIKRSGSASTGTFGGGVLKQQEPQASPRSVLTSPSGGAGSWTSTGGVFATNSGGAVQKKKPHSQPTPTPTAEPKSTPPAPTPAPTPTAEPQPSPTTPTRTTRDHRGTPRTDGDRSSPGVTRTRPNYEDAVRATSTGPSEARKPKIRDHRAQPTVRDHQGVDPATRSGPSEARKPKIRDHRAGAQSAGASPNVPSRTAGSGGQVCGIAGTPPCQRQ